MTLLFRVGIRNLGKYKSGSLTCLLGNLAGSNLGSQLHIYVGLIWDVNLGAFTIEMKRRTDLFRFFENELKTVVLSKGT